MSKIYVRYKEQIGDYQILVSIKDVRKLSMRVAENGEICLSVPLSMRASYHDFVLQNHDWIATTQTRVKHRMESHPKLTPELLKEFYDRLPAVFERCESAMGLRATSVKVRMMKSRWGSCNPRTGAITINFRLAAYPPECLEYVVIHELAHLVHPNHSKDFWTLVYRFCPEYKFLKQRLRE